MKINRLPAWCIDIWLAAVLLLRIPMPHLPDAAFQHSARAVWAYPLVGVVVGGAATVTALVSLAVGLPVAAAAGLALAAQPILTGALHEDGLADSADGLWGGHTPQKRLEIMKDSYIGAFGVLALVLVTGLRWVAMTALLSTPLTFVVAAVLSRATMPMLMAKLPPARSSGLAHGVGRPGVARAGFGVGLSACLAVAVCGTAAIIPAALAALVAMLVGRLALVRIGGHTGDVLGAVQQLSEVVVLLALCITLA